MADIPALVLHHDEPAVLTAVEMSLAAGVPTKTHGLNLLHRLADGIKPAGPTSTAGRRSLCTTTQRPMWIVTTACVPKLTEVQIGGGRHAS